MVHLSQIFNSAVTQQPHYFIQSLQINLMSLKCSSHYLLQVIHSLLFWFHLKMNDSKRFHFLEINKDSVSLTS